MAGADRATQHRLSWLARLEREPYGVDFHVALRRLESFFRELPRWGAAVRPSDEPVRLGQDPELVFAPSAVASFKQQDQTRPARLSVAFFGLFGPNGPLPLHLTEYARERVRHAGDRTFSAFVDVFHHRLLALFHRAWAVGQPTAAHDRPLENRFTTYIASLIGLGLPALRDRDVITDAAKLQYAALIAHPSRNPDALAAIIADYFGLPVAIEEFVGEWLDLPDEALSRLAYSAEVSTLGRSIVLGRRVWRRDHKFRIVLGPLSRADFHRMQPGSASLAQLSGIVRSYAGDELDWDVRLVLDSGEGGQARLGRGDRLGWDTRLGAQGGRREDILVHPRTGRTQRMVGTVSPTDATP
jgi:type VI secretion system protein ImpH